MLTRHLTLHRPPMRTAAVVLSIAVAATVMALAVGLRVGSMAGYTSRIHYVLPDCFRGEFDPHGTGPGAGSCGRNPRQRGRLAGLLLLLRRHGGGVSGVGELTATLNGQRPVRSRGAAAVRSQG